MLVGQAADQPVRVFVAHFECVFADQLADVEPASPEHAALARRAGVEAHFVRLVATGHDEYVVADLEAAVQVLVRPRELDVDVVSALEVDPEEAELPLALLHEPGSHFEYMSGNSVLAARAVQEAIGGGLEGTVVFLHEHFLGPLGMHSTNARVRMRPELRARHAKGYVFERSRFVPTDLRYLHLPPAGLMSSTAADMATFMLAHLNLGVVGGVRILDRRTAALMQTPLFQPHEELPPVLHGFYRSDRNGQIVFGHGGDTNQFHSNMSLLPEIGLGVFVSYNSDPASVARSNVVAAFLDHFFPTEYLPPSPDPTDIELSDYVGEYIPLRSAFSTFERIRSVFTVGAVTTDGAYLSVNRSTRWVPTGQDRFSALYGDAVLVFERDDRGRVSHLIAGSPLATLKRARGLEGGIALPVALFVVLTSFAAVLVWMYRLLRPIPEDKRLPTPHVRLAGLHALGMGTLLLAFVALAGDTVHGIPLQLHLVLLAFNANLLLGLLVMAFALKQWLGNHGTLAGRTGYTLVALAAALNLCLGWSYNLVGYLF